MPGAPLPARRRSNAPPLQGCQPPPLETRAPDCEGLGSEALRWLEEASLLSEPDSETGPGRHQPHARRLCGPRGWHRGGHEKQPQGQKPGTTRAAAPLKGGQRGQEAAEGWIVATGPSRFTWNSQRHKHQGRPTEPRAQPPRTIHRPSREAGWASRGTSALASR